ncbi:LysR family transcriptional regulator [Pseudonocardia sp. KRD-184]|uniref:LysR family transcriptional regulator n=1 Tax=Pseudonocardia oceani TaxID=2792013 RepID=A0ABS6U953_9PSEU|nr:LysR family transcriptional regulator [Pseudonocardia oceani]MBW0093636.1 LysR family transcriptional regulator [Pseudonocardia oceani]MBW0100241.1 LysR family transcriptional regulator [Pseudonocardia oceani]MBW0112952.1 LysR family transcriptional regulator [Pseudonocardia oceani]MBW0124913.1 LysR family transcriptional regulator [Pseudonocardia oceani]MBW0128769.1 LysR family transcriptional regulator [Pseudonocardia oceani]
METRRLELLVALARLGSMREVADELGVTTSTVSQQIAALAREAGAALLEPVGRRVRLTPAGRRLADHAVTILAAVDAARADLDPDAEPAGSVRVAGFATAIRRSLVPLLASLRGTRVQMLIAEHEPSEALDLLAEDAVDLALVYDYALAPRTLDDRFEATPLWTARWGLAVPAGTADVGGTAHAVVARHRDADWIVNSRNDADERVVAALAAHAGFTPRIVHRADSLDLVQDLVAAGLGVGLLAESVAVREGVRLLPLRGPDVLLRAFAVVRRGRDAWAPLALVAGRLAERRRTP